MGSDRSQYKLAGVMGWPVAHSRSPVIHNHWIAEHQLVGAYVLLPVQAQRLQQALRALPALGFAGCNLTIPHKVEAMQWVDHLHPMAKRIGAINTIVVEPDGSLTGKNTDGFGYMQSLLDVRPDWQAKAGPIVVLGAGGAARAVIASLIEYGATEIRLLNRTFSKAQELSQEFGIPVQAYPWESRDDALANANLLVNTTNQGMHGEPALDIALNALPSTALVSDIIYVPIETPLLAAAKVRGNTTINGLGMLLNQARPAFESWFGVRPEITPTLLAKVQATF
ncbi:shikimate dehydrogenase [Rhodoferax aquaticus]|uniref:Shikimate dehydrogenase (NADP(+)) n=1 Tax=Rhodoferax aquaticus TaxID=2527691 RepID=A0A515EMZ5_9BURK|nr:shikimate dehydrogenase [Rhodoferax aquaticus]QDL54012.1 shikimate dehydrogenase [Rhodoferax aquaticus]